MPLQSKPHTRAVGRFLNKFEADERQEQGQSESWDTKEAEQVVEVHSPNLRSRVTRVARAQNNRPDTNERRLLGISEKSPADAVKISTPMPKPFLSYGGYYPRNTLSQPRSTQNEFYLSQTQKNSSLFSNSSRLKKIEAKERSSEAHENDHGRPNKRIKTDSSPAKGSSRGLAIEIEDSQDSGIPGRPPAALRPTSPLGPILQRLDGQRKPPGVAANVPPTQAEPDIIVRTPQQHFTPRGRKRSSRSYASSSPDELDDFTRNARMERKQHELEGEVEPRSTTSTLTSKKRFDDMLASSPPLPERPRSTKSSSTLLANSKQPSRMELRLQIREESPDALQGACTTGTESNVHGLRTQDRTVNSYESVNASDSKQTNRLRHGNNPRTSKRTIGPDLFPLNYFICYEIPSAPNLALLIDKTNEVFALDFIEPLLEGTGKVFQMLITKIITIHVDKLNSRIMIVTNGPEVYRRLYFQFKRQHDTIAFCDSIQAMNVSVKLIERQTTWMDKAFEQGADRLTQIAAQDAKRETLPKPVSVSRISNYSPGGVTGVKRSRLIDKLDEPSSMTIISGADRTGYRHPDKRQSSPGQSAQSAAPTGDRELQDGLPKRLARTTRYQNGKTDDISKSDVGTAPLKEGVFKTLTRWKRPLVYPQSGKKRETVQFDDLQRLDDDEFLNDNLVCLFIRYLEEHADPDQLKRIHFFNSFLFEALTKDVKVKRGINFDSVKRWTAKVDLFSRDFVVVPVNEHLHWFVMIICNLSYFRRRHPPEVEDDEDDNELLETTQATTETMPEIILKSNLEEADEPSARNSFADMTLEDQCILESSQATYKSSSGHRGRKKIQRSLQKYDVDKPVIITLDSLDQPRSTTASLLRQYIVAEAKDKKGWDIDGNEIKGMTAKGIPHQSNFSDCGLYLCMYLEQFILDPYVFVRRILQRDDAAGWPSRIASSDLRNRLRDMLLKLHEEQYPSGKHMAASIPPLGSILVEMGSPEYEENQLMDVAAIRAAKSRSNKQEHVIDESELFPTADEVHTEENIAITTLDDFKRHVNQPVVIEDDAQSQTRASPLARKRTRSHSHYFTKFDNMDSKNCVQRVSSANKVDMNIFPERPLQKRQQNPTQAAGAEPGDDIASLKESVQLEVGSQTNGAITTEVGISNVMAPRSESPAKPPDRKKYQKFRKSEHNSVTNNEIEDSDFEGFPNLPDAMLTQVVTPDDQTPDGLQKRSQPRTKQKVVVVDITREGGDPPRFESQVRNSSDMLV